RCAGGRRADGSDGAGQEGQARQAHLHSGAGDRAGVRRRRRRCRAGARFSRGKTQAMNTADWVALLAVVVCLLVSFFFSGSETALTASSRATMLRLAKDGDANAGIVNRLLEARERLIGALLVGNNVATIAASSLATGLMLSWFGDVGVIYATAVMTVLIVVFCEVLPKTAAFDQPDRIALRTARPMRLFVR